MYARLLQIRLEMQVCCLKKKKRKASVELMHRGETVRFVHSARLCAVVQKFAHEGFGMIKCILLKKEF